MVLLELIRSTYMLVKLMENKANLDDYRVIHFIGDIDEGSTRAFIEKLDKYNFHAIEQHRTMKSPDIKPVTVILSTYGGDAYCALTLYEALRTCMCPIHVFVSGYCMSGGFIFICGADLVTATKNTRFMYHQLSTCAFGTLADIESTVVEDKVLQDTLDKIITENSSIKQKQLDKVNNRKEDWYMSAKEAASLGLVDKVI